MNLLDLPDAPPLKAKPTGPLPARTQPSTSVLKQIITSEAGKGVAKFITEQIDLQKPGVLLLTDSGPYTSQATSGDRIRSYIDLKIINTQRGNLDDFLHGIHSRLPDAGMYIGCLESNSSRKEKIYSANPRFLARTIWGLDFIFNRVLPKWGVTRGLYRLLLPRRRHFLSKAEGLGRLSYAGFEIIGHELIQHRFYFSVIKIDQPRQTRKPSMGLLFKMPRISKGGKSIGVYKIRTMHPYSEFLQNYVVRMNGYNEVGKPNRDFRLTAWGKIIRKLHLDELPQLLNVVKGELAIVGVRPISRFGFESLPKDLQENRIQYKPGCIPPNVSLGLTGFEGVIKAERRYLRERHQYGPFINLKYFFLAFFHLALRKNESS
jgi:lipopolysaccharide/colanic/teichoic acid biosynthesis glycosyltransferase